MTELFELVEEALDDVALLVEIGVVGTLHLAVSFRRDDRRRSGLHDPLDEMVSVIALVGNRHARVEAVDKIMGKGNVVALAGTTDQTDRVAKRIAGGMDFGAQPAPRPAQALGIRPPFSLRAPAAC